MNAIEQFWTEINAKKGYNMVNVDKMIEEREAEEREAEEREAKIKEAEERDAKIKEAEEREAIIEAEVNKRLELAKALKKNNNTKKRGSYFNSNQ